MCCHPAKNGPNFLARIAFAAAHHASGEWSRVLDALSCRSTPDYQTIISGGEATIDATMGMVGRVRRGRRVR